MLSKKAKYAIKALLALAEHRGLDPVRISDLARAEQIPPKFLELILLELKRHGFVHSQRGRSGGYLLARPAGTISFGQVVRAMDGPIAPLPCASVTGYRRCADCVDEQTCAIRKVMRSVRDAMAEILDRTTLADALGGKLDDHLLATVA